MEQEDYSEEENNQEKSFPTSKERKRGNSKRFSDEQVKLLESVFSRGTKLEPRKKLQLARDIGLQPRQVSIWFQNKRARWKTKQLEQEYRVLKTKFDALHEQHESLQKEKETLLDQFDRLRSLLDSSCNKHEISSKNAGDNVKSRDWGNRDKPFEVKENNEETLYENEDQKAVSKYFRPEDQPQVVTFSEEGGDLLALQEQRHNLVSGCLLDESCCPSAWWDL